MRENCRYRPVDICGLLVGAVAMYTWGNDDEDE